MADQLLEFQPDRLLETLWRHEVQYVLIGGLAGMLHGLAHMTEDIDICPKRDKPNLERLTGALRNVEALIRAEGVPGGLKFDISAAYLMNVEICNLITRYGILDITFEPSGTGGYDQLVQQAETYEIRGMTILVASLDDIVRSKEAAGRDKDNLTLPSLRELLRRKRQQSE